MIALAPVDDSGQPMARVKKVTGSLVSVQPEQLTFTIEVNNKLPRVFRGAGIVVQFIVNGKKQGVDQQGYADLLSTIVPARSEEQVTIYGPPLSAVPEGATIGLFLHDVVTGMAASGEITERQNFEWYFKYST